jgi:transglutaminase-like putative cysteine protease
MKEEDLRKEAREIQEELRGTEEDLRRSRQPIYMILTILVALLVVIMVVPRYSITIDPRPGEIPSIQEVVPENIETENINNTIINKEQFRNFYTPNDPIVKQTADRIASYSCKESSVCYAKAIFYFVRDRFNYIPDPDAYEYVKDARTMLISNGGDCDDASLLLANLLGAIGIKPRLVFIPGHVYVQIYLPEAKDKYKTDGWINLDATCDFCDFGEIPAKNEKYLKTILDI